MENSAMKTYFITFTDRDFDLLKDNKFMKKKINTLFYEPSIHIYLMEKPDDVKEYEIFLSDDDIKYLQDGNTIIKSKYIDEENIECKLMMKSVYDKLPEEVVNANKTITFSMTSIYCVDVSLDCFIRKKVYK